MPNISVIIPVYNAEKYLYPCLNSVLAQTFKNIEIICIDDGSTDGSAKILKEYATKDNRIKIITQINKGVLAARNYAISQATGKYIFPLDADDKIADTLLEKAYDAIENKKGDIITFRVNYFGHKQGEFILPKPNKYNMSKKCCLVNAALFKKSDFEKSGGYDPVFTNGLEDYDLWLNMVFNHNLKIYRIDEVLFFYRMKDETESRNLQQRRYAEKLKNIIKNKYPSIKYYKCLYKFIHFFMDYKIKDEKKYIKILGLSFCIK